MTRPKPRRRRYGALTTRTRCTLLAGWLAVQVLAWQLFAGLGQRFAIAVLTGACVLAATRPSLRGR